MYLYKYMFIYVTLYVSVYLYVYLSLYVPVYVVCLETDIILFPFVLLSASPCTTQPSPMCPICVTGEFVGVERRIFIGRKGISDIPEDSMGYMAADCLTSFGSSCCS